MSEETIQPVSTPKKSKKKAIIFIAAVLLVLSAAIDYSHTHMVLGKSTVAVTEVSPKDTVKAVQVPVTITVAPTSTVTVKDTVKHK